MRDGSVAATLRAMRILTLAVLALAAGTAHAQFKCTTPAGVTFQDAPCASAATSTRVGPKPAPAAAKPWISPDRPEHIRAAFARGQIVVGMGLSEVVQLMGRTPDRMNTTTTEQGTWDQLIYQANGRTLYLYTSDNVVTALQTVEH